MRRLVVVPFALALAGCQTLASGIFPPEILSRYNQPPNATTAEQVAARTNRESTRFGDISSEWRLSTKGAIVGDFEGVSRDTEFGGSSVYANVNHFPSFKAGKHTITISHIIEYTGYGWRFYGRATIPSSTGEVLVATTPSNQIASCNGNACNYVESYFLEFPEAQIRTAASAGESLCWKIAPDVLGTPQRVCIESFELRGLLLALDRELAKS